MFYIFKKCTWAAADDDRRLICCKFFFQYFIALFQIVWIHDSYAVEAHRSAQCLQINLSCRITFDVVSGRRILLMTGHTGNGIIQNDNGGITLVIGNICQTGHTGMHKGGITDYGYCLSFTFFAAGFVKSVNGTDGCTHAKSHIHSGKGSYRAKGIAADVSKNRAFILGKSIEQSSVRASCTHNRRSSRKLFAKRITVCTFSFYFFRNEILRKLAADRKQIFS